MRFLTRPSTMRGMLMMLVATACGAAMHGIGRHISEHLHPFQITFFRCMFGLLIILPVLLRTGLAPLKTGRPSLQFVRGGVQTTALLLTFTAITMTPLATVASLQFAAPLFGTVLAVLFLGEAIRARRIAALVVGCLGVLIIVRPGVASVDLGLILVLLSAAAYSAVIIMVKVLTRTDSSLTITLYMSFYTVPISLVASLFVWRSPAVADLIWLLAMGAMGTGANLFFAQALKEADLSAVMPMEFTKLLWASLIGYLAFSQVPDLWTWVGGFVIFASTIYIVFRERALKAAQPTAKT